MKCPCLCPVSPLWTGGGSECPRRRLGCTLGLDTSGADDALTLQSNTDLVPKDPTEDPHESRRDSQVVLCFSLPVRV